MSLEAYLTIDDSPSAHTDALTDFLAEEKIPTILFCRGDAMQDNPGAIVRAIKKGMVIANHSFSHRPTGDLSVAEFIADLEKTETLIDASYKQAGIERPGKYFRFPYLDKGDGDRLEWRFGDIIQAVADQRDISLSGSEKVKQIQDYLKKQGFSQPFAGITHPLYQNRDLAQASDCLLTYTANDWMLNDKHRGSKPCKTLDDLKRQMENDPWLFKGGGPQIVLFHDQPGIKDVTIALIRHMKDKGFEFLPARRAALEKSH